MLQFIYEMKSLADEAEDDGSGPEDDYEWAPSDFSDVSSEEVV